MRRRDLIAALGVTAAWPFAAPAQQAAKPMRIGFLSAYTAEGGKGLVGCFRKGLEQSGWRGGSVCLNSFPGFISGASAGVRLPREAAAG